MQDSLLDQIPLIIIFTGLLITRSTKGHEFVARIRVQGPS